LNSRENGVNIIPSLTPDHPELGGHGEAIRHGSRTVTLEIPGGLADPGDTPEEAAVRELLEETGYQADRWTKIGVTNPNPAIFSNRCYTFGARYPEGFGPYSDQTEDIEVELIPLGDIPEPHPNRKDGSCDCHRGILYVFSPNRGQGTEPKEFLKFIFLTNHFPFGIWTAVIPIYDCLSAC